MGAKKLPKFAAISENFDFDREYFQNGSSHRQSENGVINYDSS